jgi:hypothetical protein
MTFNSLRDKIRWIALICAFILFSLDMYCWMNCSKIVITSGGVPLKIDNAPNGFRMVWLLALLITLLSGLLTLPRWQSFFALFAVGLAIFLLV